MQADAAINRLLRVCQRDIRRSVKEKCRAMETHWINLMIDRAALLLPRCRAVGTLPNRRLTDCCAADWPLGAAPPPY